MGEKVEKKIRTDKLLEKCALCPHRCRVNRLTGKRGFCEAAADVYVSSAMAHHGEEPPISGTNGSGTIFFSYCNMKCLYCQNYQISQEHEGARVSIEDLAGMMITLQEKSCHNINFVSPGIWVPQILDALDIAKLKGLRIPLVYNTGGYDSPATIRLLEGTIDIYMPDIRYSSNEMAEKYSKVKDYVRYNRLSLKEMYRQVGGLSLDKNGIAKRGLLVRLLVLPNNISGLKESLEFIRYELSNDVYLSIMAQYHPEYEAYNYPELSRRVYREEYLETVDYAEKLGLVNGWTQDHVSLEAEDLFRPDFKSSKVFKYYDEKN